MTFEKNEDLYVPQKRRKSGTTKLIVEPMTHEEAEYLYMAIVRGGKVI